MADWLFQKKIKNDTSKTIKNDSMIMIHKKKLRLREERERATEERAGPVGEKSRRGQSPDSARRH
jgi:hypothetical protein